MLAATGTSPAPMGGGLEKPTTPNTLLHQDAGRPAISSIGT
jgi:hypothetical protein